jgi:hypothetical protein
MPALTRHGVSENLCAQSDCRSRVDEPILEQDSELGLGLAPFTPRHFPLSRHLTQDEVEWTSAGSLHRQLS